MYKVAVKNLYIGKSLINYYRVYDGMTGTHKIPILASTKVGTISIPIVHKELKDSIFEPDYVIPSGEWYDDVRSGKKTYIINNNPSSRYMIWFTGIPIVDFGDIHRYIFDNNIYTYICMDRCHRYLVQVTPYYKKYDRFILG